MTKSQPTLSLDYVHDPNGRVVTSERAKQKIEENPVILYTVFYTFTQQRLLTTEGTRIMARLSNIHQITSNKPVSINE